MGRGRQLKRGQSKSGGRQFSTKRRRLGANFTKKQKSHLRQYGEAHPVDDIDATTSQKCKVVKDIEFEKRMDNIQRAVASSSEDDEPQDNAYMNLLSSLGVKETDADSTSSDVDDERDDDDDYDDNDVYSSIEVVDSVSRQEDKSDDENEDDNDNESRSDVESIANITDNKKNGSDDDSDIGDISVVDGGNENVDMKCLSTQYDPFSQHFDKIISESFANLLLAKKTERVHNTLKLPEEQMQINVSCPTDDLLLLNFAEPNVHNHHVKQVLCNQLASANLKYAHAELKNDHPWTPLQQHLFTCINSYQDLYCPARTYKNCEELRVVYCLHIVNHMLKTRGRIVAHNSKIQSRNDDIPDEFRDKGFTRPKVVVLLPFRDSALKVINIITELLADKQSFVSTRKRFLSEYTMREDELKPNKHVDNETVFAGNTNECFTIGLGIAKKTLKLYTKFSESDIILASPLGLWGVTEKQDDEEAGSGCDFLSSIEVLIVDQADVLFMQNWDHVLSVIERINRQPVNPNGIDFSRIRLWTLNGWSKLYRQTIMLSEFDLIPIQAAFTSCCWNYSGRLMVRPVSQPGIWCQVVVRMRHEFCRFNVDEARLIDDRRFEFFKSSFLSVYSDGALTKTLIFVASSFDFIRLRNLLMRQRIEFTALSEYDESDRMKRARSDFVNEDRIHLMLITERFLFYRRREFQKITGVRHVLFYDLPTRPHFYSDICNWVRDLRPQYQHNENSATCRILYCKYDIQRLKAILGTKRAETVHLTLTDSHKCFLNPPMLE